MEFQSQKPQLCNIYIRIETICKTILKNFMNNAYVESRFFLKINENNVSQYKPLEKIYLGTGVNAMLKNGEKFGLTKEIVHKFHLNCLSYYIELFTQIKKRFENIEVYKMFYALNPTEVLSGSTEHITDLIEKFPDMVLNKEEINSEFREISSLSGLLKKDLEILDFQEFWFKLCEYKNALNEKCFSNICNFVFNIMSLPHSSACAERIFSDLNNIKTKTRNRLLPETCNALLVGKGLVSDGACCHEWSPTTKLMNKKVTY